MIQLNIRYDPGLEGFGFDPLGQADYYAREFPPDHRPRFPYSWRIGGVGVLGLRFERRPVKTSGNDPYAGTEWRAPSGGHGHDSSRSAPAT